MSKRIIMSVLFSIAISVGGFFVSCGSGSGLGGRDSLIVQLPDGCSLISPKDQLGALGDGQGALVNVNPGENTFVIDCGDHTVSLTRHIDPGQRSISFSQDDLR